MKNPESEAHTVRRIEAFSDIVIGFCLAEVGANLAFPKNGDMTTLWTNAAFFLMAFTFIVVIWWFHHRIFAKYFVLNPFTLVMNFVILAGIVLTAYFFQVFVHAAAAANEHPDIYLRLWLYSFSNVYALLGVLLIAGMWMRRTELLPADLRWGIQRLTNIATAVVLLALWGTFAIGPHGAAWSLQSALVVLVATVVVNRVLLPRALKRWVPDR